MSLLGKWRRTRLGRVPKILTRMVQSDTRAAHHLENIFLIVVEHFRVALEDSNFRVLVPRLNAVEPELRGFAYEGAGMGLALLDIIFPWKKRCSCRKSRTSAPSSSGCERSCAARGRCASSSSMPEGAGPPARWRKMAIRSWPATCSTIPTSVWVMRHGCATRQARTLPACEPAQRAYPSVRRHSTASAVSIPYGESRISNELFRKSAACCVRAVFFSLSRSRSVES